MEQTSQLVETITKGIQEKKGQRIVVADLNSIEGAICRYFVICQGNSPSQVEAITESIGEMARKELGESRPQWQDLRMRSGWLWIMEMCWCMCFCLMFVIITTWSIFGTMLSSDRFQTWTNWK